MKVKVLAIIGLLVVALAAAAQSVVPTLMNYQGRLTKPDGAPVQDGTYKIVFKLFDAPTQNGAEKWSQVIDGVVVKNGVFAVMLGGTSPLTEAAFSGPRFLQIQLNSDPPLAPRQQIVTVAYAMVARSAEEAAHAAKADQATNADHSINADHATSADAASSATTVADGAITTAKLAPNASTEIVQSETTGSPSTTSSDWVAVPGLSLNVNPTADETIFVTLNASDVWNDLNGCGVSFRITVDGIQIAFGGMGSFGYLGSTRIPVSVSRTWSLSSGGHTISAEWKRESAGTAFIGQSGQARLIVLRLKR